MYKKQIPQKTAKESTGNLHFPVFSIVLSIGCKIFLPFHLDSIKCKIFIKYLNMCVINNWRYTFGGRGGRRKMDKITTGIFPCISIVYRFLFLLSSKEGKNRDDT